MPVRIFNKMSLQEHEVVVNPVNGEENSAIIIGTLPAQRNAANAADSADDVDSDTPPAVVTRELTQTDRINKRLLQSFLERINASGQFMEHFAETSASTSNAIDSNDDFEEQLYIGTQIM